LPADLIHTGPGFRGLYFRAFRRYYGRVVTMRIVTMKRGNKRMAGSDPLSVLVVDEDASILAFLARLLDANGIRALLARSAEEAVSIAQRSYIPINLILTDVTVREAVNDSVSESDGAQLASRLRQIRPDARVLYMCAYTDAGMIRIQLMNRQQASQPDGMAGDDLIASIRSEASASVSMAATQR
jgi:CheY-like chemotaxis protein